MPPALTIAGGQIVNSVPDVCKTPTPAGTIPTPYPNLAMPQVGNPTAAKVMISGSPSCTKATKFQPSNGDQPGATGGVASGKIMGKAEIILASMKVKLQGNPAAYQGNMTTQNDNNTTGSVALCGQFKVMING